MNKDDGVIIVGGGVIGICSAYYLISHGIKVTVLDKAKIGHGSSFGNSGLIVPSHSIPLATPGVILQGFKWMFEQQTPSLRWARNQGMRWVNQLSPVKNHIMAEAMGLR